MSDKTRTGTRAFDRRRFLGLAAGASAAAALAACAAPETPTPAPAPAAPKAVDAAKPAAGAAAPAAAPSGVIGANIVPKAAAGRLAEQELVVGLWASPHAEAIKRLAPMFTELTGKKVTVRVESPAQAAANTKKLAMWQSKTDDWDVVHNSNSEFLLTGPAGFMESLEPYFKSPDVINAEAFKRDDFPKNLLDTYTYNGQLYVLPFEASTLMFFARKDLLEKYGVKETPPIEGWTWDKVLEVAQTVQEGINKEGNKDLWAMSYQFKGNQAGTVWLQTVYSLGGKPFKDDLTPQFNSEQGVRAAELLHDMVVKQKVASQGVLGYSYQEMVEVVNNSQAVMTIHWNASAETNENASKSQAAGKLAYSAMPYGKEAGANVLRVQPGAHGLGVNPASSSAKKETAAQFVAWYTSPEVARDYVINGGGVSGRQSLLSDPKIVEKNPWFPAMLKGYSLYFPYPQTPHYTYLRDNVLSNNLTAVWSGQATVKQGLDKAQEEAVAFLKEKGVLK